MTSERNVQTSDPEVQLQAVCTQAHGEPVHLLWWEIVDAQGSLKVICRELRRGYYLQVLLQRSGNQYQPIHSLVDIFSDLLQPDSTRWEKLTRRATAADWQALDQIWFYGLRISGSKIFWGEESFIGAAVAEMAIARFGYAVPNSILLPVFIFENQALGISLISYFRDPERFAGENLLYDHNQQQGEAHSSLTNAQIRLKQKLDFYQSQSSMT